MSVDPSFWRGKKVFLTGHTGFKGSWLSLWLQSMGAEISGFSLAPPTNPNLFTEARVAQHMHSIIADIRDQMALNKAVTSFQPEIILHLAAQPLVRLSYVEPVATYATNVMGTVHLLEAARNTNSVRAIVNVTTDKCYDNKEWVWGYREDEPMGGYDPYSNSKGCSELVTSAYRRSFLQNGHCALASARAGNVIGGGDWAMDRLIPDILKSCVQEEAVIIRNPHATRPWQHVLEPLSGYLMLAEKLYNEGQAWAEGWNFGPNDGDARPVQWIVEAMTSMWGHDASWQLSQENHPHEANYLKLDISKAKTKLAWYPRWNLTKALSQIIFWHRAWMDGQDMQAVCKQQIECYISGRAIPS